MTIEYWNNQIQCFWHGNKLSLVELLTLKSFINNGYKVNLWRYDNRIDIDRPHGVEIRDANEVIPQDKIFFYTGKGDCRAGSLGGFSDIFRYHLLYKFGGTYIDMDSVSLTPFNFDEFDYIIKPHIGCKTVGNLLKAPAGCDFLKSCIDETEKQIDKDNNSWVLPVKIFNTMVEKHNLQQYIVPVNYFGQDDPDVMYKAKNGRWLTDKQVLPKYVHHWCKEASYGRWQYRELYDWDKPKPLSIYYNLLAINGLI